MRTTSWIPLCVCALLTCSVDAVTASRAREFEGPLNPFLGKPICEKQTLFDGERMPNVVVAVDGTVVATWGSKSMKVRRSTDAGKTWTPQQTLGKGIHGGGVTVDETTGQIFVFVHPSHPKRDTSTTPRTVYRSPDNGQTWKVVEAVFTQDVRGHVPSLHMAEHGITLRHGKHAGRLIRPARVYNETSEARLGYNTAIYSDDHGKTWKPSKPFPEKGTGEGTLCELSDGRLYYNSRVHYPKAKRPTRRRCAYSDDGGETWKDWAVVEVLPDGRQDRAYGCMGGLVRLPVAGRDILIFSNIDTPRPARERATVWASFDGGKTWPVKRLVDAEAGGYSSLAAGRPGTPSEGWIFLLYEKGPGESGKIARFNLSWLLQGKPTGDGEVPKLR